MSEHDGYRLSVRFGEEILAKGHTAIPNLVLNYYVRLGLSGPELLFTIHVWQHWWSDRDPYPSLRTIASRMGISIRQAKRYVEALESKGFLRVIERFLPDGSQTTNEFDYSPLIRAVVDAARADGALDPGAAPAILRRTRSRATPGDTTVTPPPDTAVTPADAASVTPPMAMPATGPRSATSPKEDVIHADSHKPDRETEPSSETLTELLDLFATASERPATREERVILDDLVIRYAPLALQATPPASGAEWVAAALVEALQASGTAGDLEALPAILDGYAALAIVPPPRPAAQKSRSRGGRSERAPVPPVRPDQQEDQPAGLAGVWRTTLDDLREQMVPANFARWFARTRLLSRTGGQAVVGVPDQVSAEQFARRFDPLVRRALADACGEPVTVRYEVAP